VSLVGRLLAAIKRPDSPPRHVVTDAVWVVEPTEYVDPRPVPTGSLFDDPERLDRAWDATLASYRSSRRVDS
jgi:hypothetical protein